MKYGLVELIQAGLRFFTSNGSTYVGVKPPATPPASSFDITLLDALPASEEALTINALGLIGTTPLSGGGSVTSVALAAPTALFDVSGSPVTGSGTLTLTLDNQSANTVFAGPTTGAAAEPGFRALVYADVSAFVGSTSNTIAAGNDGRFHTQNTDTGTTQPSFAIDSGGTGVLLLNSAGELQIRNLANSAYSNLRVGNLVVEGTTTTVNSETVTIADNIILLNSDVTGTPTENSGIEVERGTSTNAQLLWDETEDEFTAGVIGGLKRVALTHEQSFQNADLVAGVLTLTHSLGQQYPAIVIADNTGRQIIPDEITFTSSTVSSIDLTSFGTLTGTWNVRAIG